jgi:hypothetical protein
MYRSRILLTALLAFLAGCDGPSARPVIYPKPELQPTAIALATNVPEPPLGIESITLEERAEMYTGIINQDRFIGYQDIITARLVPPQICEPDDSIDVLDSILTREHIKFFINGDDVTSVGNAYGYGPDDTCVDIPFANTGVYVRLAPGWHMVTIQIEIPTQSRMIEYTIAINVVRGSVDQ